MFANEFKSGHLSLVKGDYDDLDAFRNAIQGHTRMLMLVTHLERLVDIKRSFGSIAYESGVEQIVDISSHCNVTNRGPCIYPHYAAEEALFKLSSETGNHLVTLRPGNFMSNHLQNEAHTIKVFNMITGVGAPHLLSTFIDPRDIADVAVSVFLDPVEKHANFVYDVQTEALSNKKRAEIFSKVLGREIGYEQEDPQIIYDRLIQCGMSHLMAYESLGMGLYNFNDPTPQIKILTRREPRKFEDWIRENRQAFE